MKSKKYVFFVSYLPEFHYQPLKLSNVRPTDFANSKHTRLELNSILVQPVELNNFNEVDTTLQQLEGMDTANDRVATSSQQQQYDLMGTGNKGDRSVFDLFKKRVYKSEKEISQNDEIISFLTE